MKRVISPPASDLSVLKVCTVRWSDNKQYQATILALGDRKCVAEAEKSLGAPPNDENSWNSEEKRNPPAKRRKIAKKNTTDPKKFVLDVGLSPLREAVVHLEAEISVCTCTCT